MSGRRLARLVSPEAAERLEKAGIRTTRDLLLAHSLHLSTILDLGAMEVEDLLSSVCARTVSAPPSALELLRRGEHRGAFLATSLPTLDEALRGGLPLGSVTEVCGTAGVGKTQFCLTCALSTIMPTTPADAEGNSRAGGVVYIDTERKFSVTRLVDMARALQPETFSDELNDEAEASVHGLLQSVSIEHPRGVDDLLDLLSNRIDRSIVELNARLVVVDSITQLPRAEIGDNPKRSEVLFKLASQLKRVAEDYRVAVLVTNQATPSWTRMGANMDLPGDSDRADAVGSGEQTAHQHIDDAHKPMLGTGWTHCLSTRMTMRGVGAERELCIVKSPLVAEQAVRYEICGAGMVEAPAGGEER